VHHVRGHRGAARHHPEPCQACGGSGQRTTTSRQGNVVIQHVTACAGRGTVIHDPCTDCAGHGTLTHHDRVTVQIAPGIEDGTALRVPGRGLASPAPGGQAGDAYVVVHTAGDPRFHRRGADLWRIESLSVPDAVLGTRRLVPTIDRDVPLTIPRGANPVTCSGSPAAACPTPTGPRAATCS
jgi:molecular chaperone DnaJ